MKITNIEFIYEVEDIFDDITDVSVTLEDGHSYVVVVTTPKNLMTVMNHEKSNFLSPGDPMIIVNELTKEVVQKAIEAYAEEDAYYLKVYAADWDIKTLNVLNERYIARDKLLDERLEKGESIDFENYALIDFDINNL